MDKVDVTVESLRFKQIFLQLGSSEVQYSYSQELQSLRGKGLPNTTWMRFVF